MKSVILDNAFNMPINIPELFSSSLFCSTLKSLLRSEINWFFLVIYFLPFLGISYSVNTQELLVERCLEDDQQLLNALAPDPILESDLLTLDDSTLKSELNDDIDLSAHVASVNTNENVTNNFVNDFTNGTSKPPQSINPYTIETRKRRGDFYSDELCNYIEDIYTFKFITFFWF